MASPRPPPLALIYVLWIAAIALLLYTAVLFLAAQQLLVNDGELWWRTSPPGSLFPIPRPSGLLQALSPASPTDQLIYFRFIRTGYLALLTVVLFLLAVVVAARRVTQRLPPEP